MHRLIFPLCLVLLPLAQVNAVAIETAHSQYYDAEEIRPVSQYFGSALGNQRFRTVVASQPDAPAGHYFIIKLDDPDSPAPVSARLTYYRSDSKEEREHSWSLAGESLKKWLYLGLSGEDWPAKDVQPLAWRLELLDSAGAVLAEWKSFLWEM